MLLTCGTFGMLSLRVAICDRTVDVPFVLFCGGNCDGLKKAAILPKDNGGIVLSVIQPGNKSIKLK